MAPPPAVGSGKLGARGSRDLALYLPSLPHSLCQPQATACSSLSMLCACCSLCWGRPFHTCLPGKFLLSFQFLAQMRPPLWSFWGFFRWIRHSPYVPSALRIHLGGCMARMVGPFLHLNSEPLEGRDKVLSSFYPLYLGIVVILELINE